MDRRLLERVIGAGVLLVLLLLIVPAVLDGDREAGDAGQDAGSETDGVNLRTHTIRSGDEPDGPPVPQPAAEAGSDPDQPPPAAADTPELAGSEGGAAAAPEAGTRTGSGEAIEPPAAAAAPEATAARPQSPAADGAERPPAVAAAPSRPPAAPQGPKTQGWAVQLGSFSRQDNAERLAAELQGKGFPAFLQPTSQDGKTLYRVRVGPVSTREVAVVLAARLDEAGYRGQVTSD